MKWLYVVPFLAALVVTTAGHAAQTSDVMRQIEQMVSAGESAPQSLGESIRDGIEQNQKEVSKALVQRLNDQNLTENQQVVYVWALGLARDPLAVGPIKSVYGKSKSTQVKGNCLRALAVIGGPEAETFLLSTLDSTTGSDERFDILNLLGQMQSQAALPKTEEILRLDDKLHWKNIIVFGKMGDKAVPFLIGKIGDKDRNIRANSIDLLGHWLIPQEAAKPLQERFWMEKDVELRLALLGALEKVMPDPAQMKAFFQQVVSKGGEQKITKFAQETVDSINEQSLKSMSEAAKKKQPSPASFQSEYTQLFKSAGKKGNYEALGAASTVEDEPRLKELREMILQRDSDEAFYDYQKINKIIIMNRIINVMKNK